MKLLVLFTFLLVHSWYDQDCCEDTHCHPIEDCEELHEQPNGSYTWTDPAGATFFFRADRIRPSKDGKCHVCTLGSTRYGLCAYIQLGT